MNKLLQEIIDRLYAIHEVIERAIIGLPDAAMDWEPGPDMNTLGVLVAHTFGATRFWVGEVAGGEPSGRVREAEFLTVGVGVAEWVDRSHETLAYSQSVLSRLSPTELDNTCIVPNTSREVSVAWAILHALEHAALHAGHIEITRHLWMQHSDAGHQIS